MKRDAGKEQQWWEAIHGWRESGQSVRDYCGQRGLEENLFYRWRRELKLRATEADERRGFVELVRPAGGGAAGVSVRIAERIEIVLQRGFDGDVLRSAVACLVSGVRAEAAACAADAP